MYRSCGKEIQEFSEGVRYESGQKARQSRRHGLKKKVCSIVASNKHIIIQALLIIKGAYYARRFGHENLCSQLKRVGIDVDVDLISLNRHLKERMDKIKSTLQNLLQLLRSGSDYQLQNHDDGKDEVSGHKIKSLFRCKECNHVFPQLESMH